MFSSLAKKFYAINPLESTEASTPKETKHQTKESSAAFPPMAASAPEPLSGMGKTAESGSTSKLSQDTSSAFPPMSSVGPKPLFGVTGKTSETEQSKSKPAPAQKVNVSSESKKDTMGFGGMFASLSSATPSPFGVAGGASVTSSATTAKAGNTSFPTAAQSGSSTTNQKDYHKILTDFYQKHNPAKVSEVTSNLEKYKGKEEEMFAKLSQKYKTKNPLEDDTTQQAAPSLGSFGGFCSSLPGAAKSPSPFASAPATQASPFGGSTEAEKPQPFSSLFGAQTATPFGGSSSSTSPFGAATSSSTPQAATPFGSSTFGSGAASSTPAAPFGATSNTGFGATTVGSSFGQGSTSFGSSTFGSTPAPSTAKFGGRNPRDLLVNFYTSHNPAKLAEVDKTLAKYAGKEDLLFLNLAKKYNVDPAQFGVNASQASVASPLPAFGAQGSGFGAPSFGSPAPLGGGATATGGGFGSSGGVFGTSGGFSGAGGSTFGSLAAGSAFGGASASFGAAPANPFGAARR
jgi:hypothetical protein